MAKRRGKRDPEPTGSPDGGVTRRALLERHAAAGAGLRAGNLLVGGTLAADAAVAAEAVSLSPRYYPLTDFSPEIDLAGKVAVITGASSGNGRAAGEALAARGVEVIGTSRDVASVPSPPDFTLLDLDITKPRSVSSFVGKVKRRLGTSGKVDILINNAGRGVAGNPVPPPGGEAFFFEQLRLATDTLYTGHLRVTTEMMPLLPTTGYGRVCYTISAAAYMVASGVAGMSFHAYTAMKRSLLATANSVRAQLQQANSSFGVSTVNPYMINTRFPENLIFTEAVSPGSPLDQFVTGIRQALGNGLPASFVGETYWQLLSTSQAPANVVVASPSEPWATKGGNQTIESTILAENNDAACVFTAQ
jgi:NAD(P)-dependent dehydrogenase (short-subunit alcohol dehydrogenase family)